MTEPSSPVRGTDRRRSLDWGKVAATTLTTALHALVLSWLVGRDANPDRPAPGLQDQVIQLSFIDQKPSRVVSRRPGSRRPQVTVIDPKQRRAVTGSLSRPVATFRPEDAKGPVEAPLLDLSVKEATPSFQRDPMSRTARHTFDAPLRMPVAFTDRSIGGVMRRMTNAAACRELQAALRTSPTGATGILASMKRYGCAQ